MSTSSVDGSFEQQRTCIDRNGLHLCRKFHIGSYRSDMTPNMQFGDCYYAAFKMSLTVEISRYGCLIG